MNKFFKFLLSLLIGLVVFLIVIQRVGLHNMRQAIFLLFNVQGLAIVTVNLLFLAVSILRWQLILKYQGERFSFKSLTPLWMIGFSLSYLTPFTAFGGEIFRIYFTRKKFPQLSSKKAISSVAIDKLLDGTVFFSFLFVGLAFFISYGTLPSTLMILSLVVFSSFFLFILGFFYFKNWKKESVLESLMNTFGLKKLIKRKDGEMVLEAEKEVFQFFSLKHKQFWYVLCLSVLKYSLQVVKASILIFFLVGTFDIIKAFASYSFVNVAALTPLPASLGTLELSQGFSFQVLGFGFAKGTVFGMIWRGADLIFCFFGILFLIKYSFSILKEKMFGFFEK